MRALSVQQPWAWAIFHGKGIENRTQNWQYRGPLAIHASARDSAHGWASPLVAAAHYATERPTLGVHYSAIVGVVDLVDVHHATGGATGAGCCQPWGEHGLTPAGRHITHLVLENPRELAEPIPCRGALGLWTPPQDVIERLNGAF